MAPATRPTDSDTHLWEKQLALLWTEYEYRHDLCWRTVLQLTAAVTILVSLPYTNESIAIRIGKWILALPTLACALVLFGYLMMLSELAALDRIRVNYRKLRTRYMGIRFPDRPHDYFKVRVLAYLIILFFLCGVATWVTGWVWLPLLRQTTP